MASYSLAEIESFCSRQYPNQRLTIVPFAYSVSFTGLAQGQSQSKIVAIAANADFIALNFNYHVSTGAVQNVSTVTVPFIRLLCVDTGSNEQFTNEAIDLMNYATGDDFAQLLPYPRILSGKSSISVQVQNYAPAAETYGIELSIAGVLVRSLRN